MKSPSRFLEENRRTLGISFILITCLLMVRFIVTISNFFSVDLPMRTFMGINILFFFVLPPVILFITANKMDLKTSFFLPFIVYGLVYPVFYAFFLDPRTLLVYPEYYVSYLIGGIGLGLIGLAGNKYQSEFGKSMILFTFGITIILLNAINIIPVFYFVLTGDITPLLSIPDLL